MSLLTKHERKILFLKRLSLGSELPVNTILNEVLISQALVGANIKFTVTRGSSKKRNSEKGDEGLLDSIISEENFKKATEMVFLKIDFLETLKALELFSDFDLAWIDKANANRNLPEAFKLLLEYALLEKELTS